MGAFIYPCRLCGRATRNDYAHGSAGCIYCTKPPKFKRAVITREERMLKDAPKAAKPSKGRHGAHERARRSRGNSRMRLNRSARWGRTSEGRAFHSPWTKAKIARAKKQAA